MVKSETDKCKATLKEKANEIIDVNDNVVKRKGVLSVPVVNAKYIAKIVHRNELQNPDNVKQIVEAKKWESFWQSIYTCHSRGIISQQKEAGEVEEQAERAKNVNREID